MNDDDKIDVAIRPVLPSRAQNSPRYGREPILGLEPLLAPVVRSRKPRRKKSEILSPLEIGRIDRNRKKNMKKIKAKAVRMHAAAKPNRPLELKNQLQAVLDICAKLSHEELGGFRTGMEVMLNLSRPGRKRVLDALAKVYG